MTDDLITELAAAAEFDRQTDRAMNDPAALLKAACFYARLGLPVFPLIPGEKRPLIPSAHPQGDPARGVCVGECGRLGHGLHDATTDPDTAFVWWSHSPRANIGIRTGVLVDVIDVDGPAGFNSLRTMQDRPGLLPRIIGQVRTTRPDFGAHLYVRPTGAANGTAVAPGIDYRGIGGYAVAPPSFRAETGRRWQWHTPLDLGATA